MLVGIKSGNLKKLCAVEQWLKLQRRWKIDELSAAYLPEIVENVTDAHNYFEPPLTASKEFTLVLPPPNITGNLHLGHALTVTIEDVLVRWNRMRGIKTVWVPGVDHAGIATQVVVEKRLWQQQRQTRHDLGRDLFVKEIWKWKEEKANVISQQLRVMGASLTWPLEMFSMDLSQSRAVKEAFIRLYDEGLIYRSDYLVNWSCFLQSAISDIEVEHLEVSGPTELAVPGHEVPVQFGVLTKFAYKLLDADEEVVVATTRPETMLGDVAVAVNPRDNRYSHLIGREVWHPFRREALPIISDEFVDPEFGTGAVKVTPAHDPADFEVGKRHGLNRLQIIDEKGNLNDAAGDFSGLSRFRARSIIVEELERLKLLRGRQDHRMVVPICGRSRDVVEFLIKPQWFVKSKSMASKARDAVMEGKLKIDPPEFEERWCNWHDNIRDWCVSRQLWWGHRIPMYFCRVNQENGRECWVAAEDDVCARRKASAQLLSNPNDIIIVQDEDVLDTWFSSALFPFSAFGWPESSGKLSHYPLSIMETGHDILFFWVSRMVMLGLQLTGQLPFAKILLHGIICDAYGRKMSKSLGNVITPENVILGSTLKELENSLQASRAAGVLSNEEFLRAVEGQRKMFPTGIPACGVDALRFTLCSHDIKNHFINFDINECNTNRLFCNKIWQAAKFTTKYIEKAGIPSDIPINLSIMDRWILSRLSKMVENVNRAIDKCELHLATTSIKNFLYYDFCDIYLESTKRGLKAVDSEIASGHLSTLRFCLDVGLRTLAPFMPYLSQRLHRHLSVHSNSPLVVDFPQSVAWRNDDLEEEVRAVLDSVVAIRRLKKLFGVSKKHKPEVRVVSRIAIYKELTEVVADLAACDKVAVASREVVDTKETAYDTIGSHTTIHLLLPPDISKTLEMDLKRLEQKKEKVSVEVEKMRRMMSAESYRINAAAKVQQTHAKKIQMLEDELSRIETLQKYSSL
uniref:valine--tRNA ligase n=1 Tax=Photinus pyralis TaxID=7054 RepID=A0A1Y1N5J3_PHOPY